MITYRDSNGQGVTTNVYLDGKLVGSIKRDGPRYWYYLPKGSKVGGHLYTSIEAVKRSLEAD